MDESLLILEQILELVQKLEMPERRWLLERLEAVECNNQKAEKLSKRPMPSQSQQRRTKRHEQQALNI